MEESLRIGLIKYPVCKDAMSLVNILDRISNDVINYKSKNLSNDDVIEYLIKDYLDSLIYLYRGSIDKPGEMSYSLIKSLVVTRGAYTIIDQVQEEAVDLLSIIVVIRKEDNGNKTATVVDISNNDTAIATYDIDNKTNSNTNLVIYNTAFSKICSIVEFVVNYVIGFADKEDNYPYQFALTYEIINMALEHMRNNKV